MIPLLHFQSHNTQASTTPTTLLQLQIPRFASPLLFSSHPDRGTLPLPYLPSPTSLAKLLIPHFPSKPSRNITIPTTLPQLHFPRFTSQGMCSHCHYSPAAFSATIPQPHLHSERLFVYIPFPTSSHHQPRSRMLHLLILPFFLLILLILILLLLIFIPLILGVSVHKSVNRKGIFFRF